jgi:hypothetical protein
MDFLPKTAKGVIILHPTDFFVKVKIDTFDTRRGVPG